MKIETPLHTDHQLDQLAGQFEHWRQNRLSPRERIPQPLWDQAVALARVLPRPRVAQHLRLSSNDLKKHMAAQLEPNAAACRTTPSFVEVAPATASPQAPLTTEPLAGLGADASSGVGSGALSALPKSKRRRRLTVILVSCRANTSHKHVRTISSRRPATTAGTLL